MTSDLKIQLYVDTSIPLPQAAFGLVGTVRFTNHAKPTSLYLWIDPDHIRSVGFEANTLSLCFNLTQPPTLVGPPITPLIPKGKQFRGLFNHMTTLSTIDKITIYFDPASIGAEVQAQFAHLPSIFSSTSRPARSDSYYDLRKLYRGKGGQLIQLHTTVGRLSFTTSQDHDDQSLELAGSYPANNLDSPEGFASASAPGLPNDTGPKAPSSKGLVAASSRSTSPDLGCHVNNPNMEAIVTWEDRHGRHRHTLDLTFGLHIDTSKRTALFSLHHHYSDCPRPSQLPIGLLIYPEDIAHISLTTNDAKSLGVELPRSIYIPNRFDKLFRLDLKMTRTLRLLPTTYNRLEDVSPIWKEMFSSLRQAYSLSIYIFTQDMDFRDRIRFLPSAVLPTEPRFRLKAPDPYTFLPHFFDGDRLILHPTRPGSVSSDSFSGYEIDDLNRPRSVSPNSSSGYETAQEELPPPDTTTTKKRRRSSECSSSSGADDKPKVRRLESRIRDLEKKEVMADGRMKYLESKFEDIQDLLDSRWLERFRKR